MKNILLSCSLLSTVANAQEKSTPTLNTVYLGANYTRVNMTPQGGSSFNGNLGGLQGRYEYIPANWFSWSAQVSWRQGEMNSTGDKKRNLLDIDTWEHVGFNFADTNQGWSVNLFSGFGWRYLSQNQRVPSTTTTTFNYNEVYIPVGLSWSQRLYPWWSLGFVGTWMPQVFSTVNEVPFGGARWILERTLVNFQVEVPLTFTLYDQRANTICIRPFFSLWRDGTTTSSLFWEVPQNTYLFYGLYVDWEYSF